MQNGLSFVQYSLKIWLLLFEKLLTHLTQNTHKKIAKQKKFFHVDTEYLKIKQTPYVDVFSFRCTSISTQTLAPKESF